MAQHSEIPLLRDQNHCSSHHGTFCADQTPRATAPIAVNCKQKRASGGSPERAFEQVRKYLRLVRDLQGDVLPRTLESSDLCRLEMVPTQHCTSCIGLPNFASGECPGYFLSVPSLSISDVGCSWPDMMSLAKEATWSAKSAHFKPPATIFCRN